MVVEIESGLTDVLTEQAAVPADRLVQAGTRLAIAASLLQGT